MRESGYCKLQSFTTSFIIDIDYTVLFREKDNAHVRGKWKDLKAKHKKLESDTVINIINY